MSKNNKVNHRRLKPKDPKRTLLRLFKYFRFYKSTFFIGILFIMITSIAQIAANGMLSPIIDNLVGEFNKGQFINNL